MPAPESFAATRSMATGNDAKPSQGPSSVATMQPAENTKLITIFTGRNVGSSPQVYGLNGWWTDEDEEMWIQRYTELNPAYVRLPLVGQVIEPVNDDLDPDHLTRSRFGFNVPLQVPGPNGETRHLTYERWLMVLHHLDMGIIVYIPYLPGWLSADGDKGILSTYPPNNLPEYGELVRAVVNYLLNDIGFSPEKIILEPINEPDLSCSPGQAVSCFWSEVDQKNLQSVLRVASEAAHAASMDIRVAGLAVCCNFELAQEFMQQTSDHQLLDVLTYHVYVPNSEFDDLLKPARKLDYGQLPVMLDEYGSTRYWSNGLEGALWHSVAIARLWPSGVWPVQFVMAELPGMHPGFNELGLFTDWSKEWERKPAYWVYANFYKIFPDRELLDWESEDRVWALVGRDPKTGALAIWITNTDPQEKITIRLDGWQTGARISATDNLTSSKISGEVAKAKPIEGRSMQFEWSLPAYSSITVQVELPD